MKKERIIIANLKCGGCESTINKKLTELKGVTQVKVFENEDAVEIEYNGPLTRKDFTEKLHGLGYPEATEENGLLLKLKSYASCVSGRIDNLNLS